MALRRKRDEGFDDNISIQTYTDLWNAATSTIITDPRTFEIVSSIVLATIGGAALIYAGQRLISGLGKHNKRRFGHYDLRRGELSGVTGFPELRVKRSIPSIAESESETDIKRYKKAVDDRSE